MRVKNRILQKREFSKKTENSFSYFLIFCVQKRRMMESLDFFSPRCYNFTERHRKGESLKWRRQGLQRWRSLSNQILARSEKSSRRRMADIEEKRRCQVIWIGLGFVMTDIYYYRVSVSHW